MAESGLPPRQRSILEMITEYCRVTGEPCQAAYIARRLSLHQSTVSEQLGALYRKGWLRGPNSPAFPRRWIR